MVLAPFSYIKSLPSKGVRNSAIDGLDAWYHVPPKSLETIQEITNLLHASSLMSVFPCFFLSFYALSLTPLDI